MTTEQELRARIQELEAELEVSNERLDVLIRSLSRWKGRYYELLNSGPPQPERGTTLHDSPSAKRIKGRPLQDYDLNNIPPGEET